jgi:hypothetical protein
VVSPNGSLSPEENREKRDCQTDEWQVFITRKQLKSGAKENERAAFLNI